MVCAEGIGAVGGMVEDRGILYLFLVSRFWFLVFGIKHEWVRLGLGWPARCLRLGCS